MKWLMLIYDPEDILTNNTKLIEAKTEEIRKQFPKIELDIIPYAAESHGELIDFYVDEMSWKHYDHVFLVTDGHYSFDGIANLSFYAVLYNGHSLVNHHTSGLYEDTIGIKYCKEESFNFLMALVHKLYKRFAWDDASEEQRTLISSLI